MNALSMNSVSLASSFLPPSPSVHQSTPCLHFKSRYSCNFSLFSGCYWHSSLAHHCPFFLPRPLHNHRPSVSAKDSPSEGGIPVINFEDFIEKDWSFLDPIDTDSDKEYHQKVDRIILAGEIAENSKVLISFGSEGFVDRLFDSSPCEQLLVVHDSLLFLACIKEKYDKVKCWQGELIYVPQKWAPFDVVFMNFLPALCFELAQILGTIAQQCLPGARLVISHPQGRQLVEENRRQRPDLVVSELPDKHNLQTISANNSFDLVEFVDEPGFYLAVLKLRTKDL